MLDFLKIGGASAALSVAEEVIERKELVGTNNIFYYHLT
jgi:hypothetical protein